MGNRGQQWGIPHGISWRPLTSRWCTYNSTALSKPLKIPNHELWVNPVLTRERHHWCKQLTDIFLGIYITTVDALSLGDMKARRKTFGNPYRHRTIPQWRPAKVSPCSPVDRIRFGIQKTEMSFSCKDAVDLFAIHNFLRPGDWPLRRVRAPPCFLCLKQGKMLSDLTRSNEISKLLAGNTSMGYHNCFTVILTTCPYTFQARISTFQDMFSLSRILAVLHSKTFDAFLFVSTSSVLTGVR